MLEWSIAALRELDEIELIVVALPEGEEAPAGCLGVPGGAVRAASVAAALGACRGDPVLVHDAARPMLEAELARRVLRALDGVDAAIAAAPVTDTTKEADDAGIVTRTLDRTRLWAVQTPQVFRRAALERALDAPAEILAGATDEASLVELGGGRVRIVAAPAENLKVTTRLDLLLAESLLAGRAAAAGRC